jgi:hypothetical protein
MITLLCGILSFGGILLWDIFSDYRDWKKRKDINHSNQGFKRIMLLLIPTACFTIELVQPGDSVWLIALYAALSFLMVCFVFWVLFDGLLSNKKRFNWWHLGSDGPEDGVLDNFLQSLSKWQHITLKVVGAALFITIYILLL